MRLRDDQRGQAIQIGFILIFGVLVISFASYQAFVVPNQNSEVEFNHNQQVQGQLQDLRNAIVSSVRTTASTSVTIDLGTTYPSRLAAANPPPPSGVLRTVGTIDSGVALSVDNAVAQDDETADYWDGSRRSFSTGLLEYQPNYNEYRNAPRTVYDNTLLYNQFGNANVSVTGQTMVDGNQLTFVVLNGSLSAARSGSYSVDVQPVSTSTGVTTVTNAAGADLSVSFPSRFPPEKWNETLASEYEGTPGDDDERHVTDVSGSVRPDGLYDITVTFEDDSYRMRLVKVGIGSGVTDEPAAYLTAADGATSVEQGKSTEVTLSVRDALANPVGEVSVNASAPDGAFERSGTTEAQGVSGPNGKVTFTYEATGTTGTKQLEFSLGTVGSGFDGSTPENATVSVDVTSNDGGGNEYTLQWDTATISGEPGVSDCYSGNSTCVYNFSDDSDTSLRLTGNTSPSTAFASVDFATNNTTVVTSFSPSENTTDGDGVVSTVANLAVDGNVSLLSSSTEDSDRIVLRVNSGSGGNLPPSANIDAASVTQTGGSGKYNIDVTFSASDPDGSGDINGYTVELYDDSSKSSLIDSDSSNTYDGSSTTVTLSDTDTGRYSEPFYLRLEVTDSAGNLDSDEKST